MATVIITIDNVSGVQAVDADTGEAWQVKQYEGFEVTPSPVQIIVTNNEP